KPEGRGYAAQCRRGLHQLSLKSPKYRLARGQALNCIRDARSQNLKIGIGELRASRDIAELVLDVRQARREVICSDLPLRKQTITLIDCPLGAQRFLSAVDPT